MELSTEILGLLAIANIAPTEKRIWAALLDEMTDSEKNELKANLQAEIDYEINARAAARDQFVAALEKGI